jgi:hypothetical protein
MASAWINFVAPTEHEGRRLWAIGSKVYFDRPPNETFHEFLLRTCLLIRRPT